MSFIARGHYSWFETIASYTDGAQPLCSATFHRAVLTQGWLLLYQVSVAWHGVPGLWEWGCCVWSDVVSRCCRTVTVYTPTMDVICSSVFTTKPAGQAARVKPLHKPRWTVFPEVWKTSVRSPMLRKWQRLWLRLGVNVDDQVWLCLNPIPIHNCNPSANPSPNTNPNPKRPTTPLLTLTDPLTSNNDL